MRKLLVLFVAALAACSQQSDQPKSAAAAPFNPSEFVTKSLLTTNANILLGEMAAKKGRVDQTRELGKVMHQQQQELRTALASVAKQKNIAVPDGIEEKKVALRDNLAILPGQVFDRGYSLAMLQDLRSMQRQMERAEQSGDPQLASFSRKYRPLLAQEEKLAAAALERVGGSPFAFE